MVGQAAAAGLRGEPGGSAPGERRPRRVHDLLKASNFKGIGGANNHYQWLTSHRLWGVRTDAQETCQRRRHSLLKQATSVLIRTAWDRTDAQARRQAVRDIARAWRAPSRRGSGRDIKNGAGIGPLMRQLGRRRDRDTARTAARAIQSVRQ